MTPKEFVENFFKERNELLSSYFDEKSSSDVSKLIIELGLEKEKVEKLKEILKEVLRDAFYTTLLGLDGEAQIGGRQETYKILDEDGNILTGGEIESFAWQYFQSNDP